MLNAGDVVAVAAIAAGAAGSVGMYAALGERTSPEVRTIVVEHARPADPGPPTHLRLLHPGPRADLRVVHAPYVVIERLERAAEPSVDDARRILVTGNGHVVRIEKRRDHRPDRKRKRRRRGRR